MRQVFGWLGSCPETKRTDQFLRYGLAPVAADEYISYCSEAQKLSFAWALLLSNLSLLIMEVYFLCLKFSQIP